MNIKQINWIFLGDSITEGIGSSRDSYVSELAKTIRDDSKIRERLGVRDHGVHEVRLRMVDADCFNPFLRVNVAGMWSASGGKESNLWLWNLSCEGTTILDDDVWLPLIRNLSPPTHLYFTW